ncbi:MAG: hypothetical protein GC171_14880 [Terrimonas sp.]|nr:hypothetical protein [Terrimonas sp.]
MKTNGIRSSQKRGALQLFSLFLIIILFRGDTKIQQQDQGKYVISDLPAEFSASADSWCYAVPFQGHQSLSALKIVVIR